MRSNTSTHNMIRKSLNFHKGKSRKFDRLYTTTSVKTLHLTEFSENLRPLAFT